MGRLGEGMPLIFNKVTDSEHYGSRLVRLIL